MVVVYSGNFCSSASELALVRLTQVIGAGFDYLVLTILIVNETLCRHRTRLLHFRSGQQTLPSSSSTVAGA